MEYGLAAIGIGTVAVFGTFANLIADHVRTWTQPSREFQVRVDGNLVRIDLDNLALEDANKIHETLLAVRAAKEAAAAAEKSEMAA